jgi:hypothetical protein
MDTYYIEYRHLIVVIALVLLGIALLVGMVVTPYVHGQPLLLTRENLAVKTYLDQYSQRLGVCDRERATLTALLVPSSPGAAGLNVFEQSQRAREAQARLNDLANIIEQTTVPSGLMPLDDALRAAVAAHLDLATKTLTFVGRGDEASRTAAVAASQDAKAKADFARQTLRDALR